MLDDELAGPSPLELCELLDVAPPVPLLELLDELFDELVVDSVVDPAPVPPAPPGPNRF